MNPQMSRTEKQGLQNLRGKPRFMTLDAYSLRDRAGGAVHAPEWRL
jgi:hypothetical protein